jgi:Met-zincin/Domain of unknown function (DUF5117)
MPFRPSSSTRSRDSSSRNTGEEGSFSVVRHLFGVLYAIVLLALIGVIVHNMRTFSGDDITIENVTVTSLNVETASIGGDSLSDGQVMSFGELRDAYDDITSDLRRQAGFIDIVDDVDADRVYLDIPVAVLTKPFIVTALFEHGDGVNTVYHMPASDTDYDMFLFEKSPDSFHIDLKRPQLNLRNPDDETINYAVEHGTWTGYIKSITIAGIRADANNNVISYLVEATNLAKLDGFFVFDTTAETFASHKTVEHDIGPRFEHIEAFAQNLEFVVQYHFATEEDRVVTPVGVHFSLALLPETPMIGRVGDDRIGFFETAFTDLGTDSTDVLSSTRQKKPLDTPTLLAARRRAAEQKKSDHIDKPVSLINRWRLEKTDPSAPVSPVKKPIVYYIDPSVPKRWRKYIKEGVENWRPAFEAAGYKDAIHAVLEGDVDWNTEYSAGDIRFSSISWGIDATSTFALGPSNVDPRSGEIINADIVFTHGWIRSYLRSFEQIGATTTTASVNVQGMLERVTASSAGLNTPLEPTNHVLRQHFATVRNESRAAAHKHGHAHVHSGPSSFHHRHCQHHRTAQDATSAQLLALHLMNQQPADGDEPAIQATPPAGGISDAVIGAGLRDVTMHEVGHTLGLRHNFKASTAIAFDQLRDSVYVGENGLTSSVMDYLPVSILTTSTATDNFFTPVVGKYDIWAIRYGYTAISDEKTGVQHPDLKAIASEANTAEKVFATDEDSPRGDGEDPATNLFDLSADPLAFYEDRVQLVRLLQTGLRDRMVAAGQSWSALYNAQMNLYSQLSHAGTYAAKFLGGGYFSKAHRGDAGAPASPAMAVDVATQRRALQLIVTILTDDALFLQEDLLPFTVKREGWCSGISQDCLGVGSADLQADMESIRESILDAVFAPERLERMKHNYWGPGIATLGLNELFSTLTGAIFGGHSLEDFESILPQLRNRAQWPLQTFYISAVANAMNSESEVGSFGIATILDLTSLTSSLMTNWPVNQTSSSDIGFLRATVLAVKLGPVG